MAGDRVSSTAPADGSEPAVTSARSARMRSGRGRRRVRRRWVALAVLVLLSPAIYSYTTTMLRPSSLPLFVRSVEWLRAHHGNWLVDEVEHIYYGWKAPKKGGPQLKSLPSVGEPAIPTDSASTGR